MGEAELLLLQHGLQHGVPAEAGSFKTLKFSTDQHLSEFRGVRIIEVSLSLPLQEASCEEEIAVITKHESLLEIN
jgi:hypothetical protein